MWWSTICSDTRENFIKHAFFMFSLKAPSAEGFCPSPGTRRAPVCICALYLTKICQQSAIYYKISEYSKLLYSIITKLVISLRLSVRQFWHHMVSLTLSKVTNVLDE